MLFGPDSGEGRLERLVAHCRELFEAGDLVGMDALLRRHQDIAAVVRKRVLGQSLAALERPDAPRHIGPFAVLGLLGEGGMGRVYLAEQATPPHRLVAIKVIRAGMDSRTVLARFEAERQALAMLEHEHIARVLEAGSTAGGQPYFVMEYIGGEPLTEYCNRHRLDTRARVALFVDLCRAVQYAHERGLVHRDLKPANVLVAQRDGAPLVKVIDFGVACAIGHGASGAGRREALTEHGQVIGTPQYMAPEQCAGGASGADARSDVYSLGVMLCELLCGALPFDSAASLPAGCFEQAARSRDEDPAVPSTIVLRGLPEERAAAAASAEALVGELRGDLDWITFKALRASPADRYQSARELAEDLSAYLDGGVVSARPPGVVHRLRRFLRRRRSALRAAAVALLAAGAGAGGVLGFGLADGPAPSQPQIVPMVRLEPSRRIDDELRVTNDGAANLVVQFVDADGHQLRTVEVSGGQTVTQSIPWTSLTKANPVVAATPVADAAGAADAERVMYDRPRQFEGICAMDCLAEGTVVRTPHGPVPIEHITPGAWLETVDGAAVQVRDVHTASALDLVQLRVPGRDGAVLVTAGHPFLTVDRGWVAAAELRDGDALCGADGGAVEVSAPTNVPGAATVWSLELARSDAAILVGDFAVAAAGSARAVAAARR